MNKIWNESTEEQKIIVNLFKDIFINQKKENIQTIFSTDFGVHNGCSLAEYCEYEFEEFKLKCEKFNLSMNAEVKVFNLPNNLIYFSLGSVTDSAVFESLFIWDSLENKLKGNQYKGKIEPKIQFKKYLNVQTQERRINLKYSFHLKNAFPSVAHDEFLLSRFNLNNIMGGSYCALNFIKDNDDLNSYFDTITSFTEKGVLKNTILMRGKDHPLFVDNLYPILSESKKDVYIEHDITVVILNIVFDDNEEKFIKYPTEKEFHFEKPIKSICLTDNLSFDWIVLSGNQNG